MKYCSCHGGEMPESMFYRRSASADGLQAWCKVCQRSYNDRWRKDHPAKLRARLMKERQMDGRQYEMFEELKGDIVTVDISSKNDLLRFFNRLIKAGLIERVVF